MEFTLQNNNTYKVLHHCNDLPKENYSVIIILIQTLDNINKKHPVNFIPCILQYRFTTMFHTGLEWSRGEKLIHLPRLNEGPTSNIL